MAIYSPPLPKKISGELPKTEAAQDFSRQRRLGPWYRVRRPRRGFYPAVGNPEAAPEPSPASALLVTISFSGPNRMDNVLKEHRCPIVLITAALAGSHQNSRAVVMSRTVKNQLFRKTCFVARFSEEIAN